MNDFVINILSVSSYISAVLIIILGSLVVISLLLYPIWYVFNTVLYKHIKGVTYFVQFIRYKKHFIKWFKETRPDVYKPKLKEGE